MTVSARGGLAPEGSITTGTCPLDPISAACLPYRRRQAKKQIGVDVVAPCHNRYRYPGLIALRDDPEPASLAPPTTTGNRARSPRPQLLYCIQHLRVVSNWSLMDTSMLSAPDRTTSPHHTNSNRRATLEAYAGPEARRAHTGALALVRGGRVPGTGGVFEVGWRKTACSTVSGRSTCGSRKDTLRAVRSNIGAGCGCRSGCRVVGVRATAGQGTAGHGTLADATPERCTVQRTLAVARVRRWVERRAATTERWESRWRSRFRG